VRLLPKGRKPKLLPVMHARKESDGPQWEALATVSLTLALALALTGCQPAAGPGATTNASVPTPATAPNPPPTAPVAPAAKPAADDGPIFYRSRAQTGLPRVRVLLGPHEVQAETCSTLEQIATGLMHRTGIGPEEAMLFVFGSGQRRSFYMRNVPFPIAAGYIDAEGILQEIVQLKAMDITPVPSKSENIQYVLETAPDWFEKHGIGVGTQLATAQGPFATTVARLARLP
jgi:uncharacterized membrane protein (UPF0127 family)